MIHPRVSIEIAMAAIQIWRGSMEAKSSLGFIVVVRLEFGEGVAKSNDGGEQSAQSDDDQRAADETEVAGN